MAGGIRNVRMSLADIADDPERVTWPQELPSGLPATLRPLRPDDKTSLGAFFEACGETTSRFYSIPEDRAQLAISHCEAIARYDKLRLVLELVNGELAALFEYSTDLVDGDVERYRTYGLELIPSSDIRYGLCVRDDQQGRGVASAVHPKVMRVARGLGADRVILWGGVMASNRAGLRFYRKHGFREAGFFKEPGGKTSIDMWVRTPPAF